MIQQFLDAFTSWSFTLRNLNANALESIHLMEIKIIKLKLAEVSGNQQMCAYVSVCTCTSPLGAKLTGNEEDKEAQMGNTLLCISSCCRSVCNSPCNNTEDQHYRLDSLSPNQFLAELNTCPVIKTHNQDPRINTYLTSIQEGCLSHQLQLACHQWCIADGKSQSHMGEPCHQLKVKRIIRECRQETSCMSFLWHDLVYHYAL